MKLSTEDMNMKVIFTGQDYILMLERRTQELQRLRQGKLEAPLKEAWSPDKNLGKVVSLELAETNAIDGIELKYEPKGAESWEVIKRVQVKINGRAYTNVRTHERFGTRYNGSDKIEIVNGFPEEL